MTSAPRFVSVILALASASVSSLSAELKTPSVFGDNMVLQRDKEVRVWGWDNPGQKVSVEFAGNSASATAARDGRWDVSLPPMDASAEGRTMTVKGSSTLGFSDVLVGEVWLCSGQSNMQWTVAACRDGDIEALAAKFPNIRLITVPQVGTQEPQNDFNGAWAPVTPESVREFSAIGFYFGRMLHQVLDVPVGLIDNAWGGSSAEAWVRRDRLEADDTFKPYMDEWRGIEKTFDFEAEMARYQERLEAWKTAAADAKAAGEPAKRRPQPPRNRLTGQHRPANLYNGVLYPVIGYTIRGAIWYQGESNAGRAEAYRTLFPLMIESWREDWDQGDFPFYWVQLADFREEIADPVESDWAELREAQTMTLKLPNTGQAVIIDIGEGNDIHPRDKQNVAKRLARHALAKDYGIDVVCESPRYRAHAVEGSKVMLIFDHVGQGLRAHDSNEVRGFAIAGADGKFVWANARIVGKDSIEVWSDAVAQPVAVRYAWANNPVANVQSREGLPLTPFRTDE